MQGLGKALPNKYLTEGIKSAKAGFVPQVDTYSLPFFALYRRNSQPDHHCISSGSGKVE